MIKKYVLLSGLLCAATASVIHAVPPTISSDATITFNTAIGYTPAGQSFVNCAAGFLIGDGIEKKKLQTKINDLGLSKKVVISEEILSVSPFLRMSQIAIHPSETEGLSNAILEEMSWGLPIIAFNVGGNSELIRNNVNGFLVNLNDEEAFIEKILILMMDLDLRIKMGNASKKLVDDFSWKNCVDSYEMAYRELITGV